MSVKRYEPVEYSDHLGMRETEHGGYVDFEDYDSLRAQLEKVQRLNEELIGVLRAAKRGFEALVPTGSSESAKV